MQNATGNELTIDDVWVQPGLVKYTDFCLLVGELHAAHGLSAKVQDDGYAGYSVAIMQHGTYTVVSCLDVTTWRGWLHIDESSYYDGIEWCAEFKTNLLVNETDIKLTAMAIANAFKAMYRDLEGPDSI